MSGNISCAGGGSRIAHIPYVKYKQLLLTTAYKDT